MEEPVIKAGNAEDILVSLIRDGGFTEQQLRIFAVWCVRESMKSTEIESDLCTDACNIAESFANGEATTAQLEDIRLQLMEYYELHKNEEKNPKDFAIFGIHVACKWACSDNVSTWIDDIFTCPAKQAAGITQMAYASSCHDGSTDNEWVKKSIIYRTLVAYEQILYLTNNR